MTQLNQMEILKTSNNSIFFLKVYQNYFFSITETNISCTILIFCFDSNLRPIWGCWGRSKVLPNQFRSIHQNGGIYSATYSPSICWVLFSSNVFLSGETFSENLFNCICNRDFVVSFLTNFLLELLYHHSRL